MYSPLDQYDFKSFLDKVYELDRDAMLKEVDSEVRKISYPSRPKGIRKREVKRWEDDARDYYISYRINLLCFMFFFGTSSGTLKPSGMNDHSFQLLKPIAEKLVAKNQMPQSILQHF